MSNHEEEKRRLIELLEAERAGVVVAKNLLGETGNPSLQELLKTVLDGEKSSCRGLGGVILKLGEQGSSKIGDFVGKVMALPDLSSRLALLVRGQKWVVRRLVELMDMWGEPFGREELTSIHETHIVNIASCERYLASLVKT